MPLHTWKLNSHAWLFIWKSVTTVLGELLQVSTARLPKQTTSGNAEPSIFRQRALLALRSSARTPAWCLLRFPRVFCFMLLLIQVFPAPISVVTKEAVENQWAQSWEPGVSPVPPFEPLGMGLLSVTWSLITLSKPARKCEWELVCPPPLPASQGLKWKGLVLFTLGKKGWQTVILHQGLQRRKKAERRFCFHFQISELSQGRRSGGGVAGRLGGRRQA